MPGPSRDGSSSMAGASQATSKRQRAFVAGWFSFPDRKATFGDTLAKDVVCRWLTEAGIAYDIAGEQGNRVDGISIDEADPDKYTLFIFVCGPWAAPQSLLERWGNCVKIGIDLSLANEGTEGFDYVLPRDSPSEHHPDIAFDAPSSRLPVAGIVLVHAQPMYGDRQRHASVAKVVEELVGRGSVAPLWLDTVLRDNPGRLSSASQFESLIRRTDFVISTRLHGLVLSLKNGVPVIAIDAVAGGAKVTAQARALGWPLILSGEDLTLASLTDCIQRCLDGSLSPAIARSRATAAEEVLRIKARFLSRLGGAS